MVSRFDPAEATVCRSVANTDLSFISSVSLFKSPSTLSAKWISAFQGHAPLLALFFSFLVMQAFQSSSKGNEFCHRCRLPDPRPGRRPPRDSPGKSSRRRPQRRPVQALFSRRTAWRDFRPLSAVTAQVLTMTASQPPPGSAAMAPGRAASSPAPASRID